MFQQISTEKPSLLGYLESTVHSSVRLLELNRDKAVSAVPNLVLLPQKIVLTEADVACTSPLAFPAPSGLSIGYERDVRNGPKFQRQVAGPFRSSSKRLVIIEWFSEH